MEPISPKRITVTDPFWAPRIRTVTDTARQPEQTKNGTACNCKRCRFLFLYGL